jgi:hypothetical protein
VLHEFNVGQVTEKDDPNRGENETAGRSATRKSEFDKIKQKNLTIAPFASLVLKNAEDFNGKRFDRTKTIVQVPLFVRPRFDVVKARSRVQFTLQHCVNRRLCILGGLLE